MSILITYPTAYTFWMRHDVRNFQTIDNNIARKNLTLPGSREEIEKLAKWLDCILPIHCMVASAKDRGGAKEIKCHVFPDNLPEKSVIHLVPGVSIISPELCFLLAAKDLSLPKLVMLADNLCGTYYFDRKQEQKSRAQITSVEKLKQYIQSAANLDGTRKAGQAISYALDFSNSPMETKLAVISQLPLRHGGYALKKPDLNKRINLTTEGQKLVHQAFVLCDFVWEAEMLVAEYDSKQFHFEEERFVRDKNRVSALNLLQYKVISITLANVSCVEAVEELFLMLRGALGMRTRKERMDQHWEKRKRVIQEVFFTSESWEQGYVSANAKEKKDE